MPTGPSLTLPRGRSVLGGSADAHPYIANRQLHGDSLPESQHLTHIATLLPAPAWPTPGREVPPRAPQELGAAAPVKDPEAVAGTAPKDPTPSPSHAERGPSPAVGGTGAGAVHAVGACVVGAGVGAGTCVVGGAGVGAEEGASVGVSSEGDAVGLPPPSIAPVAPVATGLTARSPLSPLPPLQRAGSLSGEGSRGSARAFSRRHVVPLYTSATGAAVATPPLDRGNNPVESSAATEPPAP